MVLTLDMLTYDILTVQYGRFALLVHRTTPHNNVFVLHFHVTVHRTKFLYNKPNRCTNFINLIWNKTLQVSDTSSVHHQEFIHR